MTAPAGGAATVQSLMAACGLPRLEARMLLELVLARPRAWLLAHDTDPLDVVAVERFEQLAGQRRQGQPMAYLLGEREFMGHRLAVAPGVLIPRPETELLVETGLQHLAGRASPRVLDLGTGSGAIAIAIALARPDAQVLATDASEAALQQARANAATLGAGNVTFRHGDWFAALATVASGSGCAATVATASASAEPAAAPLGAAQPHPQPAAFDLIVSNPPYIEAGDVHLTQGDLRFEPRSALTDEADGLSALRRIVAGARDWLAPGAALWLEHGWDQAAAVRQLLAAAGFERPSSRRDLADIERISGASL